MPKMVVQTTAKDTMNAPVAAKNGRHRAASHNSIGNSRAPGTTVSQGSGGSEMMKPVITASKASAVPPSTSSLRGGGSRTAAAHPITSGATAIMPTTSEANQCHQMVSIGAEEAWNSLYETAPPTPEMTVPMTAARS